MAEQRVRITINCTKREVEILEYIKKLEGQGTVQEVIHDCIRGYNNLQYFNKRYMSGDRKPVVVDPVEASIEEKLTDEEFCIKKGGTISAGKDGPICTMPYGTSTLSMLASKRDLVEGAVEKNRKALEEAEIFMESIKNNR